MFKRIKTPKKKAAKAAARAANESPASTATPNNNYISQNYYTMEQQSIANGSSPSIQLGGAGALIGHSGISLDGRSLILPDHIDFTLDDMSSVQNRSIIMGRSAGDGDVGSVPYAIPRVATARTSHILGSTVNNDNGQSSLENNPLENYNDEYDNITPPTDDDDNDDEYEEENLSYLGRTDEPSLLSMESIDELPVPPPPPMPTTNNNNDDNNNANQLKTPDYRNMPPSIFVTPTMKTSYSDDEEKGGAIGGGGTKKDRDGGGCFFMWVIDASPILKAVIAISAAVLVGALVMVLIISVGNGNDGFWVSSKSPKSSISSDGANGQSDIAPSIMAAVFAPSASPSVSPTVADTDVPTISLAPSTLSPTNLPSSNPTLYPSATPTMIPTKYPTTEPTFSQMPTNEPSTSPTTGPTMKPTTATPTQTPTKSPTKEPTTPTPTKSPTLSPTKTPTISPTKIPTISPTLSPTKTPTVSPTLAPTQPAITYFPGKLNVNENNLLLSEGLQSRIIARTGSNPQGSNTNFHNVPDGGAAFVHPEGIDKGWAYASNCDDRDNGGVGALYFNNNGDVIGYKRLLEGTHSNSGGGATPWNTWMSAEESLDGDGFWDVDPFDRRQPMLTKLGNDNPKYWDSFTFSRNGKQTYFYYTEDSRSGPIRRYTPSDDNVGPQMLWREDGKEEYLVLNPDDKTFEWTSSLTEGAESADSYHQSVEGIIYDDGFLYFVAKRQFELFTLNLKKQTYKKESTRKGQFNGEPDMIVYYGKNMYFTEQAASEDGTSGIHVKTDKKYYTVLEATGYGSNEETTGVAVSPDGLHLYFAVQQAGVVYDVWRKDGYRMDGPVAGVTFNKN